MGRTKGSKNKLKTQSKTQLYLRPYETIYNRLIILQPDEFIPYQDLTDLIGYNITSPKGRNNLQIARNKALNVDRMMFKAISKKGLINCSNIKKLQEGTHVIADIRKRSIRGVKKIASTEYQALTNDQKITHNTNLAVIGTVALATTRKSIENIRSQVITSQSQIQFKQIAPLITKLKPQVKQATQTI